MFHVNNPSQLNSILPRIYDMFLTDFGRHGRALILNNVCEFWFFIVRTDKFLATVGLNCRKYLSGHFRQDKAPTQIDKNLSDQYLSGQIITYTYR